MTSHLLLTFLISNIIHLAGGIIITASIYRRKIRKVMVVGRARERNIQNRLRKAYGRIRNLESHLRIPHTREE